MHAGKAHLLVQLFPGLAFPTVFRLHQAADFGRRRAGGEKAAEDVAEIPLLIGESELHRASLPAVLLIAAFVLARLRAAVTQPNRMAIPPPGRRPCCPFLTPASSKAWNNLLRPR